MLFFFLACADPSVTSLENEVQTLQNKVIMLEQRVQRLEGGNVLSPPSEPDPLATADGNAPKASEETNPTPQENQKGNAEISVRMEKANKEDKKLSADTQTQLVKLEDPALFCTTTPHKEKEEVKGYRLSEVKSESVAAALGLKDGDLIVAVNAQPVRDPAEWSDALLHFKKVQFSILLERNGSDLLYNYSF